MKDEPEEREEGSEEDVGERNLRYGEAFGTQRDRSSTEEDAYLDPETATREDEHADESEGTRDLRYGAAFGTQRDRSKQEEGGYLDAEFGSREFDTPGEEPTEDQQEEN